MPTAVEGNRQAERASQTDAARWVHASDAQAYASLSPFLQLYGRKHRQLARGRRSCAAHVRYL